MSQLAENIQPPLINSTNNTINLNGQLQSIANAISLNLPVITEPGLMDGKMGACLFYYHYGAYAKSQYYTNLASAVLDELFESVDDDTPLNFDNGLAGIAWAAEHLVNHKFVDADTNDILSDLDDTIFAHYSRLGPDQYRELLNIVPYIIARLQNTTVTAHQAQYLNLLKLAQHTQGVIHHLLSTEPPVNLPPADVNTILFFIKETQKMKLFEAAYVQFYNMYIGKLINSFNGSSYPYTVYSFLKLLFTYDNTPRSGNLPEQLFNHWQIYLDGFEQDAAAQAPLLVANLIPLTSTYLFMPDISVANDIDGRFVKLAAVKFRDEAFWIARLQNLPNMKADLKGLAGLGIGTLILAGHQL